ncbi:MAG: radical SAM protein [Clostridia bacterium]|nr:radical SAM protein [Clostridia bacterium]
MKKFASMRLEVTSKCNLNCKYCHNLEFNNCNNDMTIGEIKRLIINAKQIWGVNKILITGGEPLLLNGEIFKLISFISKLGIKADLVTNGTLLTAKVISNLEHAGLKRIRISIDNVEKVQSFRGDKIEQLRLWETAKLVKQVSNINLCIHTVCSSLNVESLYEIYKKVLEINADRWRVFDLGYQGALLKYSNSFNMEFFYKNILNEVSKILDDYLSLEDTDILDIEINNIFKSSLLRLKYNKENSNFFDKLLSEKLCKSPCDYVTDHQITVRSDGKATLCQYFHNTIYDLKKYDFNIEMALKNEILCRENEITVKDLEYCTKCKYFLVCNSGCRAKAGVLTENIVDADPTACVLYPKLIN